MIDNIDVQIIKDELKKVLEFKPLAIKPLKPRPPLDKHLKK